MSKIHLNSYKNKQTFANNDSLQLEWVDDITLISTQLTDVAKALTELQINNKTKNK